MTVHDIHEKIAALERERDAFQHQAEQQLAFLAGGIAALKALVSASENTDTETTTSKE